MTPVRILAVEEFNGAFRGRLIPGIAALFGCLALAIALAGLGATGSLLVQGYTRTAVSLLGLALYVMPLLGLLAGSMSMSPSRGELELLLAQPVSRFEILAGRWLGLAAALTVATLTGFAGPGIVVAVVAGGRGFSAYALVVAGSLFLCIAALTAGMWIGLRSSGRTAAAAATVAAWLIAVILYDLGAIALLQVVGDGQVGPALLALLVLNPIDAVRTVVLVSLGAQTLLGPAGLALESLLSGTWAAVFVGSALGAWLVIPAVASLRRFRQRDF